MTAAPTVRVPPGRVLALGGLSALGPLSLDLYLPALPTLTAELAAGEAAGQLSLSLCMIGLAVGQLLVGPLTDRMGRRLPLLVGTVVFALAAGLCALAPSIGVLLALRLIGGLAGGAGIVIARAMVRDLYGGPQLARVFALLTLVMGVAPVAAPLLGGLLLTVTSWRGVFAGLAVLGIALLFAAASLGETLPAERRRTGGLRVVGRAFRSVLVDRTFLLPALVGAVGVCGMFVYIAMGSFVLQRVYGLSAQQFALVFGVNALGILAAGRLSASLVGRLGPARLLTAGVVVAFVASVAMLVGVLLFDSVWVLLVPLLFLVSCTGVVLPNATALAMEGQAAVAGTASAALGLLQFVFGAAVPPLASLGGVTPLVMTATICGSAAVAVVIRFAFGPRARRAAAAGA
ncbi:MAG: Bcr/CflA family efflux MFS transporter [Pseudonocardia sp.]|nr:Bcr/CflA family efflux MFS transporter [Pseudonocardia sp.]